MWWIILGVLVVAFVGYVVFQQTGAAPPPKKGCNSCPKSKQNVV